MPEVIVNGAPREIGEARVVSELLERLGVVAGFGIIVEKNGAVVARDRYATESIGEGDRVEIVRLMGGG